MNTTLKKTDVVIGEIIETTDLDSLTFLEENRDIEKIQKSHKYKKLREDLSKTGQLVPGLVNDKKQVVDGQRRLSICRELGIPFRFCMYHKPNILKSENIISVNDTQDGWKSYDYIHFYTAKKIKSYVTLTELIENNKNFKPATLADLFSSQGISSSRKFIEKGEYEITSESLELGNQIINFVTELNNEGLISDDSKYTSAHLLRSFKKIILDNREKKAFDLNHLKHNLKTFRPLNVFASEKDTIKEIQKLYKRR